MWSLAAAGGLAYWQAETARADELYRAQLETSLQIGDRAGEADANYNLSATRSIAGDMEAGRRLVNRARELYAELGDTVGHDRTDWALANLMVLSGETEESLRLIFEALRRYRRTATRCTSPRRRLDRVLPPADGQHRRSDPAGGSRAFTLTYALRDVATATITLADGAILLVEVGLPEEAAVMLGAYHALCDVHGVQPPAGIGQLISWSGVESGRSLRCPRRRTRKPPGAAPRCPSTRRSRTGSRRSARMPPHRQTRRRPLSPAAGSPAASGTLRTRHRGRGDPGGPLRRRAVRCHQCARPAPPALRPERIDTARPTSSPPSSRRAPVVRHCQSWEREISAVAASSMRLLIAAAPLPPSHASRYWSATLTLAR